VTLVVKALVVFVVSILQSDGSGTGHLRARQIGEAAP